MFVLFFIIVIISILMWFLIYGANKAKTDEEIEKEDEIQAEYLEEWRKKHKNKDEKV